MNLMELKRQILSEDKLPKNFLRFYTVGLLLFMLPLTRSFFFHITALSILLVVIVVFYYHPKWTKSSIFLFVFIALSSFLLEMAGVATGKIFGEYKYDTSLGLKINETPLIIGINWVFLVYASQAIVSQKTNNILLRIVGAALLMVVYDSVIEWAAPPMQMWHFSSFYPPVENFIIWFLAAAFYHTGMVFFKIPVQNKVARALFWSQLLFFIFISLYSLLFIK